MTAPPLHRNRVVAGAVSTYKTRRKMNPPLRERADRQALTCVRQRRLELPLERRYPNLYDARHAVTGIGRALGALVGPLIGALLIALIVLPILALIVLLSPLLLPIELPSIDLPAIPFADITAPGWLRAIGDALAPVLIVIGTAAKYLALAGAVIFGVHQTREVRRKRGEAERVGRPELMRRVAVALRAVELSARAQRLDTAGDVSVRDREQE